MLLALTPGLSVMPALMDNALALIPGLSVVPALMDNAARIDPWPQRGASIEG